MRKPLIVYRGRYQRRRLDLVAAALRDGGASEAHVVWLAPQNEVSECRGFLEDFSIRHARDVVIGGEVWDGRWLRAPSVRSRLHEGFGGSDVVLVGAGAPFFAPAEIRRRSWWLMQGVPEERSLGAGRVSIARAKTDLEWVALRTCQPRQVIVPSERMAEHVGKRLRLRRERIIALPNTVPTEAFHRRQSEGPKVDRWVYVGSASRWQQIDVLLAVWRAAAERRSDLLFRIVSKDPRMPRMVGDAMGAARHRVEIVGSDTTEGVSDVLRDCSLAFLLRAPHVVNEVAWPVKFGEYLAAGIPVALSDIEWSPRDFVRGTDAALLIDPLSDSTTVATSCLENSKRLRVPAALADALDHDRCASRLAALILPSLGQERTEGA